MSSIDSKRRLLLEVDGENGRYHRQALISWWDQSRLQDARILVVGAGALGNELVKNLMLIGVGTIVVADLDRVENSNLARCVFFRDGDEGRYKAEVVAERARQLNPEARVVPLIGDVRLRVGLGVFAEADVVLGGLDNREARLFVNQACWKTSTPWVDGAMEGLLGLVRVFDPPDSACYECTLGEKDFQILASRRTCSLLSRDEMLAGKVPTTATTSSVVAGMQVQEAIKLLHREELGDPALAGAGYQFVGLTHDSYVVRYTRRDDCMSHDTYELEHAEIVDVDPSFGDLLERAREKLGADASLELEHEVALGASCSACGESAEILRPIYGLKAGEGICPKCGNQWQLHFAHSIDAGDDALLKLRPTDLGLPPGDIVVGRANFDRVYFVLTGNKSAIEVAASSPTEVMP
jgi:molybdopterin/thiamine biosynthesis adenylyltransferase